ncbi:DUF1798 family protein [Neobacillus sp. OS1-2]|uniref:DUF1798 family protein n=1 Tax=Neobacillus sp. OS1-2 TaxID=3070680 RepID=UPI0027E19CF0|nr:DUF1798 family protein [Neobacillus sp. OS1-2]WML40335.1 DUF1798 family protein [Neobacillus sp. OS1-2]
MAEEILNLTEKLLQYNHLFIKYYQDGRETGITHDFENVIKPFVDEVSVITNQWKNAMKMWLSGSNHKHLHLKQIETTAEHIEQLSVQAFFPKTSKSRFLNSGRTVEYFLLEVIKEVKQ